MKPEAEQTVEEAINLGSRDQHVSAINVARTLSMPLVDTHKVLRFILKTLSIQNYYVTGIIT